MIKILKTETYKKLLEAEKQASYYKENYQERVDLLKHAQADFPYATVVVFPHINAPPLTKKDIKEFREWKKRRVNR